MVEISDLQCGKAGEYLVCADLITKGHVAFPSEQGLPFDVVLNVDGKLFKIQVKTTRKPKDIPQRKTPVPAYIFHIGNNGRGNRHRKYLKHQVDMFAFVALDSKLIGYLPFFDCQTTMNFRVPSCIGKYHDEQGEQLKQKVRAMRDVGLTCPAIATRLGLKTSTVHRYSSVDFVSKGTNSGTYLDTLTLEKALEAMGA